MLKWIVKFKASENRALFVLITTTIIVLFNPFFIHSSVGQFLLQIFLSLVIISSIYLDGFHKRKSFYFTLTLGTLLIILDWLNIAQSPNHPLFSLRIIAIALFFAYITIRLLSIILKSHNVTANTIFASITVYLLLGIDGAMWSVLVEHFSPGSFNLSIDQTLGFESYIYYSFVTLSTLGYGDITPISGWAKSLSIALSSIGQLYLTILVAILVGQYLNDQNQHPK